MTFSQRGRTVNPQQTLAQRGLCDCLLVSDVGRPCRPIGQWSVRNLHLNPTQISPHFSRMQNNNHAFAI